MASFEAQWVSVLLTKEIAVAQCRLHFAVGASNDVSSNQAVANTLASVCTCTKQPLWSLPMVHKQQGKKKGEIRKDPACGAPAGPSQARPGPAAASEIVFVVPQNGTILSLKS